MARDYGLAFELDEELADVYREVFSIDLTRFNGDESWALPIPATFVIEPTGTIVWASVDPDYHARPEPEEVLAAIP